MEISQKIRIGNLTAWKSFADGQEKSEKGTPTDEKIEKE